MTVQSKSNATKLSPGEFASYCDEWLASNAQPAPLGLPRSAIDLVDPGQFEQLRSWQAAAYRAGLIGCDYPSDYGGGGRRGFQAIANEALRRAGAPYFPSFVGLQLVAPTLLFHASEELKRLLLPRLFSGEDIWCQGFSEPGAGSDLANVGTSAVRKGDRWVINGHKVWTSHAQFADRMVLLARTDKSDKRGGLTYFVVPIREALGSGVIVRPLIKITGEPGFNEVLFDDLEIGDEWRVDAVGAGWRVAMTTLQHERSAGPMLTPQANGFGKTKASSQSSGAHKLVALALSNSVDGRPAAENPGLRDRVMRLIVRQEGQKYSAQRHGVAGLTDHPDRIPLQTKLARTALAQDVAELAVEIEGAGRDLMSGSWTMAYLSSFGMTIAGGTNEIQHNIIGERVLGLPK